jgi:SAM-dependent methyltransferase
MKNLEMFADGSFDLVVHPVSNCFVPDILPVWREAFRVLRRGGCLLAGFANPALYIFDQEVAERTGRLEVTHSLPYSDAARPADEPLEFSHTLEEQIGGQTAAGFAIIGMYEDGNRTGDSHPLNKFMPTFLATRALKSTTQ